MKLIPVTTASPRYAALERLLVDAFPPDERRPLEAQRANTDSAGPMTAYAIVGDDDAPLGLLTLWHLGAFYYIEHFAVEPAARGLGAGSRAIDMLRRDVTGSLPIVLEVEPPVDDITRRRVDFYTRLGFVLTDHPYIQPAYSADTAPLPMRLMTSGAPLPPLDEVAAALHRHIYNAGRP